MADVYLIRDGGTWSNSASDIWATTAENADANNADADGIEAGEVAILNAASGPLTITASVACGGLNATGYADAMTINAISTLDLNGDSVLPAITILGTSSILMDGNLTLNGNITGGTVIFDGECACTTNGYSITGMTQNNAGLTLTFVDSVIATGNVLWTLGTIGTCNLVMSPAIPANISWSETAQKLTSLRIASGTVTRTGYVKTKKLTVDAGAIYTDAGFGGRMYVYAEANNFIDIKGTISGVSTLFLSTTDTWSNSGDFVVGDNVISITGGDDILTFTGRFSTNQTGESLQIYGGAGTYCSVVINNQYTKLGGVVFGINAASRPGRLSLYGTVRIGNVSALGNNASTLNLNSCFLEMVGTITGSAILTVTANANAVHAVAPIGSIGRFTTVTVDNQMHAHDCTVDGDCIKISADTEAYPNHNAVNVG